MNILPAIVNKEKLQTDGFAIIGNVYSNEEVSNIIGIIDSATEDNANFRRNTELFAIRNFINEIPEIAPVLWNARLKEIINGVAGSDYFLCKAIYFDKPASSNWYVTWHQDTTISVNTRTDSPGFGPWSLKNGLHAVTPSTDHLDDIVTIRIHLDDCTEENGALRVVPASHANGILNTGDLQALNKKCTTCNVQRGGIMLMKPLLVHSSGKSISGTNRRVIHLEFASKELPAGLQWRERINAIQI